MKIMIKIYNRSKCKHTTEFYKFRALYTIDTFKIYYYIHTASGTN